ncbi:hypothetical protein CJU90_5391 [Yarrowia sp. C11]|nr:hypothetical protein CJU90_5391 [Yarrowia sp. C11]KAG5363988.1 hypothetical protein CKK34_2770 [Yarrowia sp. E02]
MLQLRKYSTFNSAKSMAASVAKLFDRRPELSPEETSKILVESMEGTFEHYMKGREKHLRLDSSFGEAPNGLKHPQHVASMNHTEIAHLLRSATSETQVFVTLEEVPKLSLKVLNAALSNPAVQRIEPIGALVKNYGPARHNVVGVGYDILSWKWLLDHGKHEQAQNLVDSKLSLSWIPSLMQMPRYYPAVANLWAKAVIACVTPEDINSIICEQLASPMATSRERGVQLAAALWIQAAKEHNPVVDKIVDSVLFSTRVLDKPSLPQSALSMFLQMQRDFGITSISAAGKIFMNGEGTKRAFCLESFFEYAIEMRDQHPERAAAINSILKKQLVDPHPDLVLSKLSSNNILQSFRSKDVKKIKKDRHTSRSLLNHV